MSKTEVNVYLEVEVFRLIEFNQDKYYVFALKTRTQGVWPNQKYYTTNPLEYLGKYVREERSGGIWGDGRSCDYIFDNDGREKRISLDYEGCSCFREVETDGEEKVLEKN